jgi:hypothetical protein
MKTSKIKPTEDNIVKVVEDMYSHLSREIHHPRLSMNGVPLLENELDSTWMKFAQVLSRP